MKPSPFFAPQPAAAPATVACRTSGELSPQSEGFRARWAAHDVRIYSTGVRGYHHPVVGDLSLHYETMELVAEIGLTLLAYTAEPGSKSAEALRLLASWAGTEQAETT